MLKKREVGLRLLKRQALRLSLVKSTSTRSPMPWLKWVAVGAVAPSNRDPRVAEVASKLAVVEESRIDHLQEA